MKTTAPISFAGFQPNEMRHVCAFFRTESPAAFFSKIPSMSRLQSSCARTAKGGPHTPIR